MKDPLIDPLIITVVIILALTLLAFFFGGAEIIDRITIALVVGAFSVSAAVVLWIFYIAMHFLGKYW